MNCKGDMLSYSEGQIAYMSESDLALKLFSPASNMVSKRNLPVSVAYKL